MGNPRTLLSDCDYIRISLRINVSVSISIVYA